MQRTDRHARGERRTTEKKKKRKKDKAGPRLASVADAREVEVEHHDALVEDALEAVLAVQLPLLAHNLERNVLGASGQTQKGR